MRAWVLLIGMAATGCMAPSVGAPSNDDPDHGDLRQLTGGEDATASDFPSTVNILGNCTAAKVAPNKILTAAHCVYDGEQRRWMDTYLPGHIGITSSPQLRGESSDPQTGFVDVRIKGVYIDPAWVAGYAEFPGRFYKASDLAIIVIASEDVSKLAAIPVAAVDLNPLPMPTSVAIMGYGCEAGLNTTAISPHLKFARTKTIGPSDAITASNQGAQTWHYDASAIDQHYFFTPGVSKDFLSASICPGDSGGPVYRLDASGKPTHVVGVNSYYDFPSDAGKATISYSNWHTRFNNAAWLKAALADSNDPAVFVAVGGNFSTQPSTSSNQTTVTSVTVTWPQTTTTGTYSLDVEANGAWIAPCIDSSKLQQSRSVTFDGACPSSTSSPSVGLQSVTAFRVCWAEGEDWTRAFCTTKPYAGESFLALTR